MSRRFGDRLAVDDLSLTVPRGQIVCLLGRNGAGKTTTVRMAATLLTPDQGGVEVDGVDALRKPRAARAHTGLVLGGERGFYTRPSAYANLMFYADVAGVPWRRRAQRVRQVLDAVRLTDRANQAVGEYSRGMVQRLHVARALLTEPRLLILDEPSAGLDVQAAKDLRDLIRDQANGGAGILLTTHAMPEAEALADRVDVIRHGRIIVSGGVADIARAARITSVTTVITSCARDMAEAMESLTGVARVEAMPMHGRTAYTVLCQSPLHVQRVRDLCGPDADVTIREPTLEESYLALEGNS
ncbi:ABC transporter ATP-binding protein [Intrasporangium mesophilum]